MRRHRRPVTLQEANSALNAALYYSRLSIYIVVTYFNAQLKFDNSFMHKNSINKERKILELMIFICTRHLIFYVVLQVIRRKICSRQFMT